mgnify:CR=1 FL=1
MFRPSVDRLPSRAGLVGARRSRLLTLATLVAALLVALPAVGFATPPEREEVLRHFEILDLSDRVVLRPLATESRLPQLEIPDEADTAIVSGRELDADEVSARYGAAGGEVVASLLRLEPDVRRAALGLPPRGGAETEGMVPEPPTPPGVPEPPVPPRHRDGPSDARVAFGHGVTVEAHERTDEVVCIAGSLRVLGEVMGNAVAIGGSARVSGKVYGDVVAIGGSIHLADGAEVFGEAVAVGGTVHRAPGAKVLGQVTQVSLGDAILRGAMEGDRDGEHERSAWRDEWSDLPKRLIGIALLALLVCLVLLVAPGLVEETGERVRREAWSAGLIGLLAELLFVPLLVLLVLVLVISIIGIPLLLLVPFLLVAVVIAALVGFAGVAVSVGRWMAARFGRSLGSRYGEAVLGILAIQSLSITGDLLDLAGGAVGFLGTVVSVLGFAARFVAWTIGLGAVLLGLFARRWRATAPVAVAVPPPPPAPPVTAGLFAAAPSPVETASWAARPGPGEAEGAGAPPSESAGNSEESGPSSPADRPA